MLIRAFAALPLLILGYELNFPDARLPSLFTLVTNTYVSDTITGGHVKYQGRTYGTYKKLYISLFLLLNINIINNIWSYFLWSAVIIPKRSLHSRTGVLSFLMHTEASTLQHLKVSGFFGAVLRDA